jgi:hypothetical protein
MAAAVDPMVSAIGAIVDRMTSNIGDHPAARQLKAEADRLRRGAEALDNVRRNRAPADTNEAHTLKVAKAARKYEAEVEAAVTRANQIWGSGITDVNRRIVEKVNLKADDFAKEIRTAFRELDSKTKVDRINQMVEENRGPELAANVDAPAILTGISDQQCAMYRQAIISKHAAAELEEQEKLEEVFGASLDAAKAAKGLVSRLADPGELAHIEHVDAVAKEASAAFHESLQ